MTGDAQVRWGIAGTANIARAQFLPGLRSAGGIAAAVASRSAERAQRFAAAHGIGRAIEGYQRLLEDPGVDAVYNALPNALHAEWTIRALMAGKPVLCEKPLCGTLADTERVIEVARRTKTLLWEAFVFPFHRQFQKVASIVGDGVIGDVKEIKSNFHFMLTSRANIRLSRALQGGALLDVGCYPVRLAQEFFGPAHQAAHASAVVGGDGVDVDAWGTVDYPEGRRLLLSCGFGRDYDTFTTIEGTSGHIRISNPFHPGPADGFEVVPGKGGTQVFSAEAGEPSFTLAIRHINAVLRGDEQPRMLAVETSLPTARALEDLIRSAGQLSNG
jgi:predicted dehydrogenase